MTLRRPSLKGTGRWADISRTFVRRRRPVLAGWLEEQPETYSCVGRPLEGDADTTIEPSQAKTCHVAVN
jgi:hypothetical protein